MTRSKEYVLLALVCAALGACGGGGEGPEVRAADVDTTNTSALDGLSNEQIEAQAQPMTPEQAEARGIVDTSIHVENLGSEDPRAAGTARNDTTPIGAAGADSARADSVAPGR